jgi:hypothetical protein
MTKGRKEEKEARKKRRKEERKAGMNTKYLDRYERKKNCDAWSS